MANENNAIESFECTTVGYEGTYVYIGGKAFADRYNHNPWVWGNEDAPGAPHLTLYENDFRKGEVQNFHLTYWYAGQSHKVVHIHFAVKGGVAQWSGVDANRCGADNQAARDAAFAQKASLTQLARDLLAGAFPD